MTEVGEDEEKNVSDKSHGRDSSMQTSARTLACHHLVHFRQRWQLPGFPVTRRGCLHAACPPRISNNDDDLLYLAIGAVEKCQPHDAPRFITFVLVAFHGLGRLGNIMQRALLWSTQNSPVRLPWLFIT
jgi:hypothetical protein